MNNNHVHVVLVLIAVIAAALCVGFAVDRICLCVERTTFKEAEIERAKVRQGAYWEGKYEGRLEATTSIVEE